MPYATDNQVTHTLRLYMEPLEKPSDEPYYYVGEYKRDDMILVEEREVVFTIPKGLNFIQASIEELQRRAEKLRQLADNTEAKIEQLLALEHMPAD